MEDWSISEFFFGKKKTPKEIMREHKNVINRSIRELEKERIKLSNEEYKKVAELKVIIKSNKQDFISITVRSIARLRQSQMNIMTAIDKFNATSLQLSTMNTTSQMTETMAFMARTLKRLNAKMDIPNFQKVLMDFEKESMIMETKDEMVSDAMDNQDNSLALDESSIISQIYDEMGLKFNDIKLPSNCPISDSETMEIQKRFDALKK